MQSMERTHVWIQLASIWSRSTSFSKKGIYIIFDVYPFQMTRRTLCTHTRHSETILNGAAHISSSCQDGTWASISPPADRASMWATTKGNLRCGAALSSGRSVRPLLRALFGFDVWTIVRDGCSLALANRHFHERKRVLYLILYPA